MMYKLISPDGQHSLTVRTTQLQEYLMRYPDYSVTDAPEPEPDTPPAPDPLQVVGGRIEFGRKMVLNFLADNFASGVILTASQSTNLANAFRPVRELLEAGALGAALTYVRAWPVDAIFTVERKAKYRAMIEEYLASEAAS